MKWGGTDLGERGPSLFFVEWLLVLVGGGELLGNKVNWLDFMLFWLDS